MISCVLCYKGSGGEGQKIVIKRQTFWLFSLCQSVIYGKTNPVRHFTGAADWEFFWVGC
ncbi:MAG: hypothetical protein AVDCRST_MAG56-7439 [uncultured Cytophagales bacterium]|uniref:Uncharacterized protein n=1 Tax=uncultured Cytophagales bacterium TaxID=158755 RepID=A0A6J4L6Q4_9SPHI|nr:MAG: hypothetical protein AVDCRST_MAG56-7439 [uncultured Cytophagales bacterium]